MKYVNRTLKYAFPSEMLMYTGKIASLFRLVFQLKYGC